MSDFTVAELDAALEELAEAGSWEGWWEPESFSKPNPHYDADVYDHYIELQRATWKHAYGTPERATADREFYAYADEHQDVLWPTLDAEPKVTVNGVEYDLKKVDGYGGEGQGDTLWVVIEVAGRLFRKDGYYASYSGGEFDGDLREVKAQEKTITVYDEAVSDNDDYLGSY